ncbi:MAG: hypothetical protein ACLVAK_09865 [Clostridia bacterium]
MKRKNQKVPEQNQNITKQYAVSYAMLTYNHIHPKEDITKYANHMIKLMRVIKPRLAVKKANKLLNNNEK